MSRSDDPLFPYSQQEAGIQLINFSAEPTGCRPATSRSDGYHFACMEPPTVRAKRVERLEAYSNNHSLKFVSESHWRPRILGGVLRCIQITT